MSTTIITTDPTLAISTNDPRTQIETHATRRARVWTVGLAAGVVAAMTTSLTAAIITAVGHDIEVGGETIPTSGFATLTLLGAVLGIAIAKLTQRTTRPRTLFITATVTLTALSIIPDVVADTTWPTRLVLATTHLIAAAIIVPTVAHRLDV